MRRDIPSGLSRFIAGVMVATLVFASMAAIAGTAATTDEVSVIDDETVYVVMDATGAPRSTVVVDWLRFDAEGQVTVTDHGDVTSVEAVEENVDPVVAGDSISWTLDAEGRRDFFYRATTDKELPVDVDVTYTLDGREVPPEDVAGASGHLKIDVALTNNLPITEDITYFDADGVERAEETEYWTPMLAPVKIDVDGTRFSNIEGDADIVSVTGSTKSYTFMAFPQPDASISIEMDGEDIEIDPIIVSVFPKMAGEPDFSVVDQLDEMRAGVDGLSMLSQGHREALGAIANGLDPSAYAGITSQLDQFSQLTDGVTQLREGTDGLVMLVDGQITYLDAVIGGMKSQDLSDITLLPSALTSMTAGVESVKTGLDGVIALLDGQMLFLDGLAASNSGLEATAWEQANATGDATETAIATGLSTQTAMIDALRYGDAGMGMPYGLDYTRAQLAAISAGLGDIAAGMSMIADESRALETLPSEMGALTTSLEALRNGGVVQGQTLPGLVDTKAGLQGVSSALAEMESGLQSSAGQMDELAQLPSALNDLRTALLAVRDGGELQGMYLPGISTTVDGLGQMSTGLADGVSEANLGKAIVDRMKQAAADYNTFLGTPEGAEKSDVRFVFKLDGISVAE